MSLEELRGEDALRAEIERLHELLEGKPRYVDCICEGCPRMVPEAWLAGMCGPCSREDCYHDESAMDAAKAQGAAEATAAAVKLTRLRAAMALGLVRFGGSPAVVDVLNGLADELEAGDHIKQETKPNE